MKAALAVSSLHSSYTRLIESFVQYFGTRPAGDIDVTIIQTVTFCRSDTGAGTCVGSFERLIPPVSDLNIHHLYLGRNRPARTSSSI